MGCTRDEQTGARRLVEVVDPRHEDRVNNVAKDQKPVIVLYVSACE